MEDKSSSAKAGSFEDEFREFSRRIQHFRDCHAESIQIIQKLNSVFWNDLNAVPGQMFISDNEKAKLDAFVTKRASVLVIGQTNSGKSSLINELLGASYLPTAEVPCTSRVVRIRYNDENVLRVREPSGKMKLEITNFKKKSIPKGEIALEDQRRDDKGWTQCVVEVGLKNSLLQGGHLEFVDAPGMSENKVLDSIVQECVHGILQVVIYVIDGNSSLRNQDREFLYDLRKNIGNVPIFYVCNKVDVDEQAAQFDRDDEDDESYQTEESQMEVIKSKKMRVFSALVRAQLIDGDTDVDHCDFFHAISTREVRKARRSKTDNFHVSAFEKMKEGFLKFASASINSHLETICSVLQVVQQRIFRFYVSRNLKSCESSNVQKVTTRLKSEEARCFNKMRNYVKENTEKLEKVVTKAIHEGEERILFEAGNMEFAPIVIADVVHRNEIINQYKIQIQKMVLTAVLNISLKSGTRTVKTVTSNLLEQLRRFLKEMAKQGGLAGKLVRQQINHIDILSHSLDPNDMVTTAQVRDYSLMTLAYKTFEPPKNFLSDILSIVSGTMVNKSWKQKIAKNVLENVDYGKLTNRMIGSILDSLHEGHQTFLINLKCIEDLSAFADKQSVEQERAINEFGPRFSKVMCSTDALLTSLKFSKEKIQLRQQISRKSKRGVVYDCQNVSGEFSAGKQVVAKQLCPGISTLMYMSIQHSMTRIDEDHPSCVLRPLALVLIDSQMTLLLPKEDTDLYTALNEGRFKSLTNENLRVRMTILGDLIEACAFCREQGLQLIDPRVTNVLLDEHYKAKLNIAKPRDDSVCYPDDHAPFHVCAAPPPLLYTSTQVLEIAAKHDVYALGILGWLLAVGEYKRPIFANTTDVTKIYDAARRRTFPDLGHIPQDVENFFEGRLGGLLLDSWTEGISLVEMKEEIKKVIEK